MVLYIYLFIIFIISISNVTSENNHVGILGIHHIAKRDAEGSTCETQNLVPPDDNYNIENCETLNGNECLCDLSGKCRYDSKSQTCKMIHDCNQYSGRPTLCRRKDCVYDCPTQKCMSDYSGYTNCPDDSCHQRCGDICACKMEGCEYTLNGNCQKPLGSCRESSFRPGECRRPNSFYIHNGVVCQSTRKRGICDVKETVFAVNVGGKAYTDSTGATYKEDTPDLYIDDNKIRSEFKVASRPEFSPDQKKLYETIIYALPWLRESGRCLVYPIPVCKDGNYELVIKTIETFEVQEGEKAFNIKFGGIYVFPEIGLVKLTGKTMVPIDLILNFKIHQGFLTVAGQPPGRIVDSSINLEFCYGECIFLEGAFQVAAFAVNKLGADLDDEMHSKSCKLFHNEHWSCVQNDCRYNHETNECEDQYSKECESTCDSNRFPPAEVLFLLDSTPTGRELPSKPEKISSLVFDKFQTIRDVVDTLKPLFKTIKFGISFFSEVSCHRDPRTCKENEIWPKGIYNDQVEGCYRTHQPLTKDVNIFKNSARRDKLTYVVSHSDEPGMFATALAVSDKNMTWTPKKTKKLIILATDDKLRTFNYKHEDQVDFKYDGSDTCQRSRHPSAEDLGKVLNSRDMAFLLLVDGDRPRSSYVDFLNKMKIKYGVLGLGDSNDDIAKEIVKLLTT